jgi:hypothetical protein
MIVYKLSIFSPDVHEMIHDMAKWSNFHKNIFLYNFNYYENSYKNIKINIFIHKLNFLYLLATTKAPPLPERAVRNCPVLVCATVQF